MLREKGREASTAAESSCADARRDRKVGVAIPHGDFVLRDPWSSNQRCRCMP
jgi:hypothetical protein